MTSCKQLRYDFVVVGSGVAGLWTALHLADAGTVAVLTKDELRQGSTLHAQGGIAVALSDEDDPELHLRDTIEAGDGLCDVPAAEILAFEGPSAVTALIEMGFECDRDNGQVAFGREAAHSQRRIVHAQGDRTGAEVQRVLMEAVRRHRAIDIFENTAAVHLLEVEGRCVGVQAHDLVAEISVFFLSAATVLATGGVGCLYRVTTNPPVVLGDGIALAYRAGATLKDLEFVQFHPTALAAPGYPKFLLSEALRGDGATLVNHRGEPFMERYHKMGDLAPRDAVARAVVQEMKAADQPFAYLDLRPIGRERLERNFPTIVQNCRDRGFQVPDQPVPVSPAAHYFMGGIATDCDGRTSIPGLFAVGECSCISVHGANRLASNSLLDGLVFGRRCARVMRDCIHPSPAELKQVERDWPRPVQVGMGFYHDIRELMWDHVGVVRSEAALRTAAQHLKHMSTAITETDNPPRYGFETVNAHLVASLMTFAALNRTESRGAHYRVDYHDESPHMRCHTLIRRAPHTYEPQLTYAPVIEQRM